MGQSFWSFSLPMTKDLSKNICSIPHYQLQRYGTLSCHEYSLILLSFDDNKKVNYLCRSQSTLRKLTHRKAWHFWALDKRHINMSEILSILCSHELTHVMTHVLQFSLLWVFFSCIASFHLSPPFSPLLFSFIYFLRVILLFFFFLPVSSFTFYFTITMF